jgi:hypothetical protein
LSDTRVAVGDRFGRVYVLQLNSLRALSLARAAARALLPAPPPPAPAPAPDAVDTQLAGWRTQLAAPQSAWVFRDYLAEWEEDVMKAYRTRTRERAGLRAVREEPDTRAK